MQSNAFLQRVLCQISLKHFLKANHNKATATVTSDKVVSNIVKALFESKPQHQKHIPIPLCGCVKYR